MGPSSPEMFGVDVRPRRAPLVLVAVALVLVAVALMVGVVAGWYLPLSTGFWVVLAVVALLAAAGGLWRRGWGGLSAVAVLVAVAALGAVHLRLDAFAVRDDAIVTYTGRRHILATVRGRIVSAPTVSEDDPAVTYGYRRPPQTRFVLKARQIHSGDGWLVVRGLVGVTVREPDDRLAAGQDVEVMGWLGRVRAPDNPGQYDFAAAARRKHMLARLVAPGVESVSILAEAPSWWAARMYWHVRSAARAHLSACGDERSGSLLNALVVGERAPALRTPHRAMVRAGIAHYLSISGMHLAVFLGFVYLLCRMLMLTPRRAAMAVLVVLGAYLLLAEPRAPLVRSALMAAALCLATIAGRRVSSLNALAAAAILLLVADPMDVFAPAFQLSFGIVGAVCVWRRSVKVALFGRWLRERGLVVFRRGERLRRWWNYAAAEWLMDAVVMAVIAYAVAAPLVAYHFHLFSPYTIPLSLVLMPLVAAVLVPGYVSMALAWPMPNLAHAVGRVAGSAADGLAWVVEATQRLPGLCFELREVGIGWVVLCYAALAAVLMARRVRFGRVVAAVVVLAWVAATVFSQRTHPPPGRAELNVLSVGAGQCVVLRTPSGVTAVFDAGTQSGFDAYAHVLAPFLRCRRLPAPTVAFISHANTDHFNAFSGLAHRGSLTHVYVNEQFGRSDGLSPDAQVLAELRAGGAAVSRLSAGRLVVLDDRTQVEVLWPPPDRTDLSANDASLVLRITCDGTSVLVTGDIETLAQESLAAAGDVQSDVLMLPHHGSWKTSLEAFVQAVRPRIILVSAAREPYGPPAQEEPAAFFAHLRRAYRFYSTARHGWIQVRFGGGELETHTMH